MIVALVAAASSSVGAPSGTERRTQYISPSNTLLSVMVTLLSGTGTPYGPTACTSGSCGVSFTATPGPNTIAFTLTDGSSNVLSTFSTTVIVQPTGLNTLKFTTSPVVNRVTLSLASPATIAETAIDDLLTVNAQDIDGNTIVGNSPYVDHNGNAVAFVLHVANNHAGGKGTAAIKGPSRITGPNQAPIYLHYDGNWLQDATISVTSSSALRLCPPMWVN